MRRLNELLHSSSQPSDRSSRSSGRPIAFASSGVKTESLRRTSFFRENTIQMLPKPRDSLLGEVLTDNSFWSGGQLQLGKILEGNADPANTKVDPLDEDISAGKNTYTYDAHTYHTKVPPQGIATVISKYLPNGGLVLDPFAGSGMTGVAARYLGYDVILNELSPAASFISYNFLASIDPEIFHQTVSDILLTLHELQHSLYSTTCRECGSDTLQLYTVWSYVLECSHCQQDFVLWEHCRKYGKSVREHRILHSFACPSCGNEVKKSHLVRKHCVPVFLGYRCCSKKIMEHPLIERDYRQLESAESILSDVLPYVPKNDIPDGVNLNQPKRHGLDSVDKLYTLRNLAACGALWREVKKVADLEMASALGFVFTSMYQRVTRLSEYRFWGGSGNMANLNVPQIFNESNVFLTFQRKAETIRKHFATTAQEYQGTYCVRTGSATKLEFLPDESVDFIFTDPPFGSNINYSEMNFLWESWLGRFTDPNTEAIVSRHQGKDIEDYRGLMTSSLKEAHRVLRANHWMVLVFMNSSRRVWEALRGAIVDAGFSVENVNIFDKQHGTFKQFVSENAAGADLMIHCKKTSSGGVDSDRKRVASVSAFLTSESDRLPIFPFVHVDRETEIDYRTLYSRYIACAIRDGLKVVSFSDFRDEATTVLETNR